MKTLSLLILFLLSVFTTATAQESEFLITKNNDSIFGEIRRNTTFFNPTRVRFKIKDEKGDKKLIDPAEIKQIRSFNGLYGDCIIKPVHDEWYAKRIIDGKIEVYMMLDEVIFYTSKNNSDLEFKDFGGFNSRKNAHAEIRPLVADNPEILEEFDTLSGSQKNILYIIEKYNDLEK